MGRNMKKNMCVCVCVCMCVRVCACVCVCENHFALQHKSALQITYVCVRAKVASVMFDSLQPYGR